MSVRPHPTALRERLARAGWSALLGGWHAEVLAHLDGRAVGSEAGSPPFAEAGWALPARVRWMRLCHSMGRRDRDGADAALVLERLGLLERSPGPAGPAHWRVPDPLPAASDSPLLDDEARTAAAEGVRRQAVAEHVCAIVDRSGGRVEGTLDELAAVGGVDLELLWSLGTEGGPPLQLVPGRGDRFVLRRWVPSPPARRRTLSRPSAGALKLAAGAGAALVLPPVLVVLATDVPPAVAVVGTLVVAALLVGGLLAVVGELLRRRPPMM